MFHWNIPLKTLCFRERKEENHTDNKKLLEQLKKKVLADKTLPFREEAHTLVFGYGSENPKVFFLGEAPGKNEDLTGIPFNGAAGKILDELLQSINLKRTEIYITSVVQYRPPKNRDPKPAEIAAAARYIEAGFGSAALKKVPTKDVGGSCGTSSRRKSRPVRPQP